MSSTTTSNDPIGDWNFRCPNVAYRSTRLTACLPSNDERSWVDSSTSTAGRPDRVFAPHGLDWTLILGRRHLDRTLRIYAEHYIRQRPHRAIRLATPLGGARVPVPVSPRDVRRRDLLGGLIHEYHGAAA